MSDPHQPDALNFDRAIPSAEGAPADGAPQVRCANCARPITATYHTVNGEAVCSACRMKLEHLTKSVRSPGLLAKAAVFGVGAAIVGAIIYWAVMRYLNLEIGLVALLTGWMVGKAVRAGANGGGGRLLQAGSALLVYLSVAGAYLPFALGAVEDGAEAGMAAVADSTAEIPDDSLRALAARFDSLVAADTAAVASPDSATTLAAAVPTTIVLDTAALGGVSNAAVAADSAQVVRLFSNPVVAILAALLFAAALPILAILGSMPGGLISAAIIGFGMVQAWQLTGATKVTIEGPFRVGGAAGASPEPAP